MGCNEVITRMGALKRNLGSDRLHIEPQVGKRNEAYHYVTKPHDVGCKCQQCVLLMQVLPIVSVSIAFLNARTFANVEIETLKTF